MTYYDARATLADGRYAYEAAPERQRQPATPTVRFVTDPVPRKPFWPVVWRGQFVPMLGLAVLGIALAVVVGVVL